MDTNWVEIDPSQIQVPGSSYLWVLNEDERDKLLFKRNGTLVYTIDTDRFYVYNEQTKPQVSILRRWLRRAGWHV